MLVFCVHTTLAQKRYGVQFWEATALASSSSFLSDLGGKDGDGTNDFKDLNLNRTRFAVGGGFSYNTGKGLDLSLNAFYTHLSASDVETKSSRTARNISVRTDVIETNLLLQYTVPKTIPRLSGLYANIGAGIFLYRPMAEWQGTWYELRPLGTEGQFSDPNLQPYKIYSPVVPFGVGKKFYLNHNIALSLDFSFRKSFTDYLDDVSTSYYDNDAILANSGPAAAHFANPSSTSAGQQGSRRGNPENNDNFYLIGLKLHLPKAKYRRVYWPMPDTWIDKYNRKLRFRKNGKTRR